MLGFLFGFNARLGRLAFFGASIGLGVVMGLLAVALVFAMMPIDVRQLENPLAIWPIAIFVIFAGWASVMLQAMRLRDIGWDPVCVIPAWIAFSLVDHVVALRMPAWALGHHHSGTALGALVNLGLILALTFWPGDGGHSIAPDEGDSASYGRPAHTQAPASFAESRLARVTGRPR